MHFAIPMMNSDVLVKEGKKLWEGENEEKELPVIFCFSRKRDFP